MTHRNVWIGGLLAVLLVSAAAQAAQAQSSSPFRSWGTGGGGSVVGSRGGDNLFGGSALLHRLEEERALAVELGRDSVNQQTSSACGACVYYTIQGNNNVIRGNNASVTNSGDVQSTAEFR